MMHYDVRDEYSLWEYRILRRKWLHILKSEDRHSVYFQLVRLLDDNTKWRMVNEVRRLQDENAPSLHRMLDEWFWERQAMGIRRIAEEDDSKSKRSVYSVVRIIDEILSKREVFTRSNYINSMERCDEDWVRADCENNFDMISSSQERKPDDCIAEKFLKSLRKSVHAPIFGEITRYANKFVAHSSDPDTRKDSELNLHKLDEAYQALAEVIRVLAARVLSNSHLQFEITRGSSTTSGWDKVFASSAVIDQVHKMENDRRRLIESWGL